ncbi:MAG: PDZ domain-containing protein [Planctomycetaceae bacterium]|jgi:tricorn protease|nr:PDZ domain-containing protein [Planctomycetaceae bacterium]
MRCGILHRIVFWGLAVLLFTGSASAADKPKETKKDSGTKLLRFPDIHGKQIAFCYAGDIWKVASNGGVAVRLTAHEGQEVFPKFSPDGKWLAFTGQYDGGEQVYVIPSGGGEPKQLTFYPTSGPNPPRRGYDNLVYGWTPDSKNILFRSVRDSNSVTELGTLYTVPLKGGLPEKVGVPAAGAGDFSPDGEKLVYSPLFRDFRSWKRYEGGWAQYLVIFDLATKETKRLDENVRTEREPIWLNEETIYFTSDRTGTLNLFEYNVKTGEIAQCTDEKTWDVRWASGDPKNGQIVYELGGELVVYQAARSKNKGEEENRFKKLKITVPTDALAKRPARVKVGGNVEYYDAAPGGKRALLVCRGDIFSVPLGKGYPKNLTNTSNAHERGPVWAKDGLMFAYISDATGEDQIYLIDAKAEKPPIQLTATFKARLTNLRYSPLFRLLCVNTSDGKLYVVPTKDFDNYKKGIPVEVANSKTNGGVSAGEWSPAGEFLAYTVDTPEGFGQLNIWEAPTRTSRTVTFPVYDVKNPVWDPNGKYLYYISRREFSPQFSSVEWNFAGSRDQGIFALALSKDTPNLFPPEFDDTTTPINPPVQPAAQPAAQPAQPAVPKPEIVIRIDWDGLWHRVCRLPVSAENYDSLSATDKALFYIRRSPAFYGRSNEFNPRLFMFDLKERKESQFLDKTDGYTIASDFSKIISHTENRFKSMEPKLGSKVSDLQLDNLYVERIPSQEWAEIFNEVWRKYRDYFYVRNMHGYDWEALGRQYRELLPYVAHRSDLNYVLSEMISELNIGHCYIDGGDFIVPERPAVGLPGCTFELDTKSNRYKIAHIYRGDNSEPKYRSPLAEVGVNAAAGDYVLAIDGIELTGDENPYRLLQNRTDPITFTVNKEPKSEGSRKIVFTPVMNESTLRYLDFVIRNREIVDKATKGRAGYLHIPDMGANGAYEFIKWYYPQIRKEGLVIDVRNNGGGNISQWIIMRLNQKMLGTRFGGASDVPRLYPGNARFGHQVCLINETSASDGDIFPHYFREAGLGTLIGKRSWGGVVGISPRGQLLDGGSVSVPLLATNDKDGNWIIEGHGVDPDIVVDNPPKEMMQGTDLQLERGITELLKQMDEEPKKLPKRPSDPIKTK